MQNTVTKYRVPAVTERASHGGRLVIISSLSVMTWEQLRVPWDQRFKTGKGHSLKGCHKPVVTVDGEANTFQPVP